MSEMLTSSSKNNMSMYIPKQMIFIKKIVVAANYLLKKLRDI